MTTKKSRPFQALLLDRLSNPEVAKHYLNEALEESLESFLTALKAVAQARQMAKVAKDAVIDARNDLVAKEICDPDCSDTRDLIVFTIDLLVQVLGQTENRMARQDSRGGWTH
jgi:hypothetical protein